MHGENVVVEMDDLFEINCFETSIVGNEIIFYKQQFSAHRRGKQSAQAVILRLFLASG